MSARGSLPVLLLCLAGPAGAADVSALLRQMSLEEKISLLHGARDPAGQGQAGYWPGLPRLGIPPLRLADGPPGVNVRLEATVMPAPVALAATFSTEAARLYGTVLGREARALGQDVLLAPHINIVRDPLFRRNHTTFGEDPFLNGALAAAKIRGIQSQGVMAQVKHMAAYNGPDSVVVDERTLNEIYLPAFEMAVDAGVASVMCAYNRINGTAACENSFVLNDVLRGRWGFQGFVTSDWGALRSPLAILGGVDLEMPGRTILGRSGPHFTDELKAAVDDGRVPAAAIDQAVERILRQMDRFGLLERKRPSRRPQIDIVASARVARMVAEQGAVLLKNEGNLLPLTAEDLSSLAVIGPAAAQLAAGFLGERAYGFKHRLIPPLEALRRLAPRARITYSAGKDLAGEAVVAARAARTAVIFAWHETGASFSLPDGQDDLIRRVAAVNPRTVVVLNTGGPVAMPWGDLVPAILEMWYPGQEGGWATADILLGRAVPGGKLPVTFPVRMEDAPARAAGHPERWTPPAPPGTTGLDPNAPPATFSERLAVGYRWYDQENIQPLFPFGHGLSYTRFEYSDLAVKRDSNGVDVSFRLSNTGSRRGAEVAQVYLGPADAASPPRSLAGFRRVELAAGSGTRVSVRLDSRRLAYWSADERDWVVPGGARPVYVGSSSRDIRLEGAVPPPTTPR